VDGCTTKAPCGGQTAGPSPVGRRKQGLKRSVAVEAAGIPLAALPAPANHRDDGLLAATLDAVGVVGVLPARPVVHLDAGYDYQPCRQALAERGMVGQVATRGVPAPIQAGRRWVIERTHAWGNQYGKLRWCTERRRLVVEFWLAVAGAVIVCGRLLRDPLLSAASAAGGALTGLAAASPLAKSGTWKCGAGDGGSNRFGYAESMRSRSRATAPGCYVRLLVGRAAQFTARPGSRQEAASPSPATRPRRSHRASAEADRAALRARSWGR
jgi:hypothetical protein